MVLTLEDDERQYLVELVKDLPKPGPGVQDLQGFRPL